MRGGELLALALCAAGAAAAQPADPVGPPASSTRSTQSPAAEAVRVRTKPKARVPPLDVEQQVILPVETVDANDVLDEILDELAADVAKLGAAHVSPVLLQRVRVSDNMNPEFAHALEARMVAALEKGTSVAVVRCFECFATRSRVEGATWVVSRGITDKEELSRVAAKYGARMLLAATLTLYTDPSSLALDVELVRADDGAIAFAEGYRVHPTTAQLYRSADRVQKRAERLKDLEDRLNDRPQFGYGVFLDAALIPSDSDKGPVVGAQVTVRLFEKFGVDRQWWLGFEAGAFINPGRFSAGLLGAAMEHRVTPDDVYLPQCFVGGRAGYLVSLAPDGAWVGSPLVGGVGECIFSHRLALHAGLGVLFPFQLGATGFNYGGLMPEAGAAVLW